MTVIEITREIDHADIDAWTSERTDVVREVATGDGAYEMVTGPFESYRRDLEVEVRDDGRAVVRQRVEFELQVGIWSPLFGRGMRHAFSRAPDGVPWWAPPDVVDTRGATSLTALASLSIIAGYLGTLLTQTITFAAEEFGASDRAQGDTLAGVRIGVLLSMAVAAWADRHGRRRALLWATVAACVVTALGAIAPGMVLLGATQTIARGLSTAVALLIVVVAAEEMPAGSRAFAASLLTMSGGLGAGTCLWFLPLADLADWTWRLLFLVPILYLPLLRRTGKTLPESRRYSRAHDAVPWAGHWWRLILLSVSGFVAALFFTPASQLQNEFLRDDHGFSAAQISIYTVLTVTPGALGIVAGGRLADIRGRRLIGSIGLLGGTAFTVMRFMGSGWTIWVGSLLGSVIGGLTVPALAVYGPELFPTALRSKANGITTVASVAGSAAGLIVVGRLADRWGLGEAISTMAFGPLILIGLIVAFYPETADLELEDLNPEDAPPAPLFGL